MGHRTYGKAWLGLDPPRHLFCWSSQRALASPPSIAGCQDATTNDQSIAAAGWFLASVWRARALVDNRLAPCRRTRRGAAPASPAGPLRTNPVQCGPSGRRGDHPQGAGSTDAGFRSAVRRRTPDDACQIPAPIIRRQPRRCDLRHVAEPHDQKRLEAVEAPHQRSLRQKKTSIEFRKKVIVAQRGMHRNRGESAGTNSDDRRRQRLSSRHGPADCEDLQPCARARSSPQRTT